MGKARGKDPGEAEKYLRQLCARLDVSHICSVRKHKADLQQYVNEPLQGQRCTDQLELKSPGQQIFLFVSQGVKYGKPLNGH